MDDLDLENIDTDKLASEAKEKWGDTEAFKQLEERVKKLGKFGMLKVAHESAKIMQDIVSRMSEGSKSEEVQKLIVRHYESLRNFYEPNLEMYRGLANMYINDERFTSTHDKIAPGLAQFMHDAMIYYADSKSRNS